MCFLKGPLVAVYTDIPLVFQKHPSWSSRPNTAEQKDGAKSAGGRNEVKEAQAISPPQLLKVTGATAETASELLFWAKGAEKKRDGEETPPPTTVSRR